MRIRILVPLFLAAACTDGGSKSDDSGTSDTADPGGSGDDGGGDDGGGDDGGDDGGDTGEPVDCVTFDYFQTVSEPIRIVPECNPTVVPGPLIVEARIDIEAGSVLHMGEDSQFVVGMLSTTGQLVVAGTAAEPVHFEGRTATGDAIRWDGVEVGSLAVDDSLIEHAVFTDCGALDSDGTPRSGSACLQVGATGGGTLGASNVAFLDAGTAFRVAYGGAPSVIEGLSFDADTRIGLMVPVAVVGQVGSSFPFANPDGYHLIDDGTTSRIREDATWVAQPVPWRPRFPLVVTGEGSLSADNPGPTLTLDEGLVIELPEQDWLSVGTEGPAAIVTTGTPTNPVVLRPLEDGTRMGGLHLGDNLSSASLTGLHLLTGGGTGTEGASLRIDQVEDEVELEVNHNIFEDCAQSGVTTLDADYLRFQSFSGNTFIDCAIGLIVRPDTAGSISPDQIWDGDTFTNAMAPGPFTRDATWADLDLPWVLGSTWARGDGFELDAALTLEPGVHLLFESDTRMTIAENSAGALVAVGTSEAPISLRAADVEWEGLVFEPGSDGSWLSFVELGDAGQVSDNRVRGCLSVSDGATGITVDDVAFTNCNRSGVDVEGPTRPFDSFANNTFDSMDVGLSMHPNALIGLAAQSYSGVNHNVLQTAVLSESGAWVDQGIPWELYGSADLEIEADLAIGPGFELQSPWVSGTGYGIEVGVDGAGSLQVNGTTFNKVLFTSAEASPSAGDWRQISFGDLVGTSTLSNLDIVYAGRGGRAAIDLNGHSDKVTLSNVSVSSSLGDDIEAD